jgi:hypothetical protein
MNLSHIQEWRQAEANGEHELIQLMNQWIGSNWFIVFNALEIEIEGTLVQIERNGINYNGRIDPLFTLEITDPDFRKDKMTLTAHFARFQQSPK